MKAIRGLQIERELQNTYDKAKVALKGLNGHDIGIDATRVRDLQFSFELFTKEYEALDAKRYELAEMIDKIDALIVLANKFIAREVRHETI